MSLAVFFKCRLDILINIFQIDVLYIKIFFLDAQTPVRMLYSHLFTTGSGYKQIQELRPKKISYTEFFPL